MTDPQELRSKLVEYMESAQALSDTLGEGFVAYLVEQCLDDLRSGDVERLAGRI